MPRNMTNNQILMKEIIKQEYDEDNTYEKESDFFEFFSASQVLKNYNLSTEELESGIVGGGNDGGCDGLYVFLNNEILTADQIETLSAPRGSKLTFEIIQAKNTTGFGEDAIMKWKTTSSNLLDKIYLRYKEKGGNGRVAKSSVFVNEVDEVLEIL